MSIEILAYEPTPLGLLCLRRRDLLAQPDVSVTEVTLNHEFLMSSYLTDSERALSTVGLSLVDTQSSKGKLNVLVGGLGLGYTAAEVLKSTDVESVEVVEFLPQVIGWLEAGLIPLATELQSEPRLKITNGDIYARLAEPPAAAFDLIAIDVDHSPEDVLGEQSIGFYSEAGLQQAKSHLVPGGILGVWSYAESTPLLDHMRLVFDHVHVEQVRVFNDLINEEQTDWLFFGRR